jgi:hypothetical protein
MLDLKEFRRIRDETALARYQEVLPVLRLEVEDLGRQCRVKNEHYKMLLNAGRKREAETYYDSECRELFKRWAETSADIGEIERDIPRRKRNLQQQQWRMEGTTSDNRVVTLHNQAVTLFDT